MKHLVVYIRSTFCPDVQRTREFLEKHAIPHEIVDATNDEQARARVVGWTGYLSFPTLVITDGNGVEPMKPPSPLKPGQSPRDVDRGTMLTEASTAALEKFLKRHGFMK